MDRLLVQAALKFIICAILCLEAGRSGGLGTGESLITRSYRRLALQKFRPAGSRFGSSFANNGCSSVIPTPE